MTRECNVVHPTPPPAPQSHSEALSGWGLSHTLIKTIPIYELHPDCHLDLLAKSSRLTRVLLPLRTGFK